MDTFLREAVLRLRDRGAIAQSVNVLIVLDRSGSMFSIQHNGETYEEIADRALRELVTDTGSSWVNFGFASFPSKNCIPPEDGGQVEDQCASIDEILVPVGPGSGADIVTELDRLDTCGGTPSA